MPAPVTKIEPCDLFWKDLADWRSHKDYWAIRRQIAEFALKVADGDFGGDTPLQNKRWAGLRHLKVGKTVRLTLFTAYPENGTLRLCAIKKHDFYGFKNERASQADNATVQLANTIAKAPKISPEWSGLKWKSPSDILGNPEVAELSRQGLEGLYQQILDEQDDFRLLGRATADLSERTKIKVADKWLTDLIAAQAMVEDRIVLSARREPAYLAPEVFENWSLDLS